MAQNAPTDVAQYVTLNPKDKISFSVGVDKSVLFINNTSPTKNIAYKIRTTQPLIFVVKPNSGIIEAMSEAKIEINYVPNESVQNVAESKFQVQVAYTPLGSSQMGELKDYFDNLQKNQKSMIHAFKLPVNMNASAYPTLDNPAKPAQPENFVSMVQQTSQLGKTNNDPQEMERSNTIAAKVTPSIQSESNKAAEPSANRSDLQNQINTYKQMIAKEQNEIKTIKEEIQKKSQKNSMSSSQTVSGGAPAAINWAEDAGSSGKKFKFIHVIIVSILFLLLGSYLAKLPIVDAAAPTGSTNEETAEQVAKD